MATYTDPVEKEWVMDGYDDFNEGRPVGAEIENPNYSDKIVLECKLGTNKLGPTEKNWNPGFEEKHPTEARPYNWRFEEPSTGSTYEENAEEAYEGDDYVKLADEGEEGGKIHNVGRLILHPESGNPNYLDFDLDPQKMYTVRYHGRYQNPEQIKYRGPVVRMDYEDDETRYDVRYEPFGEEDEYPGYWARSDYRLVGGEAATRKIQMMKMNFGNEVRNQTLPHQRWYIDHVVVAETFPAQAEFFASGTYTSPTFATPPFSL
jgi:hypothetical protein